MRAEAHIAQRDRVYGRSIWRCGVGLFGNPVAPVNAMAGAIVERFSPNREKFVNGQRRVRVPRFSEMIRTTAGGALHCLTALNAS
jgi:hypothetical protein